MNDVVIRVENLSKKYLIRHKSEQSSGDGLRHAITDIVTSPFRRLKSGSRSKTGTTEHGEKRRPTEEFYALNDVSFEIKRGEVVGIIGRNGAGKSTLLKILSRITDPTHGRIGINGRVASLLEVGTGFHPELTGRENIFLNGAILGMTQSEVKSKFSEIVEFSGVEKFLDTPVKRYSSGMYVRLAFSVAAHLEPEILIVDEVLAVGDMEFQKKCIGKMQDVAKNSGRTVLFVSHNEAAIKLLCSSGVVLEHGRSIFSGGIDEALAVRMLASTNKEGSRKIPAHLPVAVTECELLINGSKTDQVIPEGKVEISLRITCTEACSFGVEFTIKDAGGSPMMLAAPAFANGHIHESEIGISKINYTLDLPRLAQGEYFVDIALVEPNVKHIDLWVNALYFTYHAPLLPAYGWRYDQVRRQGVAMIECQPVP